MELTRKLRTSRLAREDTSSSWTNGRKTACHDPAAATAGFFLNLALNSAVNSCACIDETLSTNVSQQTDKCFVKQRNCG